MAKQPWLVGGNLLEIAVVDSCDDLLYLRHISDSGGNCCGYENAELETLKLLVSKKWNLLQCYPQTSDSPRISESFSCDWNFNARGRIIVKLYSFEVLFL